MSMDDTRILSKHDARQLAVEVKSAIKKAITEHKYVEPSFISIPRVRIEIDVQNDSEIETYKYNWGLSL